MDFVKNALKNNVDRTTIKQVLSDIASGKAVFLSEKEASKEKGLAKGQCVRMDCRGCLVLLHREDKRRLVGAVGIELKAALKTRKLLILLNAKNAKST